MTLRCILLLLLLLTYTAYTRAEQDQLDCSQLLSLKARKLCREKEESEYWKIDSSSEILQDTVVKDDRNDLIDSPVTPKPRKGPVLYTPVTTPRPEDAWTRDLPECKDLEPETRQEGENCKVVVHIEPEIRWRDQVFEKLLPQSWQDIQRRINFERTFYGMSIEPLNNIPGMYVDRNEGVYNIKLNLSDIEIHGLSTIYLNETLVTRSESLSDLDMKMVFRFETLKANGRYSAVGGDFSGWFTIDSDGVQDFDFVLQDATISPRIKLDTTDLHRYGCGLDGSVLLTDIEVPFTWSDMSINFVNLGSGYNTLLNIIATYIFKSQEKNVVDLVKDKVKEELNSLLC
ncbi:uncharacterized protein LOC111709068 [Eurytemora carolleeae]|uniref:uncharacterized protein LOC111709068 n=1 Tax=Eurytemora carolleeae TaxID=1294199 RepID=UPI000C77D602|nr:uncharacterized protein LOC111709068 [Eurytemora carolleeae]|eukprot:XP_023338426.1 uncharacterized protein LOC111709068 [Eurytemora affinis]